MALTELDRTECLRLLGAAAVGRIVFTEGALPAIRPGNFLLDGDEIVFRTATGSALAAATRHAVVAFEVDEIDATTHTGWSVVIIGQRFMGSASHGPHHRRPDPPRLRPPAGAARPRLTPEQPGP